MASVYMLNVLRKLFTKSTGEPPAPEVVREPIRHEPVLNITARTSVSLSGAGFREKLSHWFHKFFARRSEMVLERGGASATSITATRVMGVSLAHNYLEDAEGYLSAAKQLNED